MLVYEIVMVALAAIRANVLRSVLTTLGIIIGVAAVIAMVALGEGAQARVEQQIQRMGTNVLTIRPGQQMWGGISRGDSNMSVDDAEALRDGTDGLLQVSPEISSRLQVTYLRWNSNTQIQGVWPEYFDIYDHKLQGGRFFNEGELQGRRRVAVSSGPGGSDHPDPRRPLRGHRQLGGEGRRRLDEARRPDLHPHLDRPVSGVRGS
jgi:ABC-type lipoprotein release transport system permease subunit